MPVSRQQLLKVAEDFRANITNPRERYSKKYLTQAQQLYQWLIKPIEDTLQANQIDTLLFSLDEGLRSLPMVALHDGQQFLVEKYSSSIIPSISLMNTKYNSNQQKPLLAMGVSEFANLPKLPGVPMELNMITTEHQISRAFLNKEAIRENLIINNLDSPYQIIHLATHAEFLPGNPTNSYIQLWDSKLQLSQIRELGWNKSDVELLVLSACRTAVGDAEAELGFAGLAIATGVKSVLGSLWYVSDYGTLGLMAEFYDHLRSVKIKAEALRQAQLAMLRGEVNIAGGQLFNSRNRGVILPAELAPSETMDFSHPYYWSGFTMVGSPW